MFSKPHILITGAEGFVGRHLTAALLSSGASVTQLVRRGSATAIQNKSSIEIDLTDRKRVADAFSSRNPDFVVHLAATKSRGNIGCDFIDNYDANASMVINVIHACFNLSNFKKLIFIGTCDEYGPIPCPFVESHREAPSNAYGLGKLAATQMLGTLSRSDGFPSIILRPSVIYGPRQGTEMFLSALIQSLVAGNDFAMTAGEQYRDFVYVDDVVDAIIRALNAHEAINGKVFNIGSGQSRRINDVAVFVAKQIGQNAIEHIKFGAIPYRPNEVMDYSVDITQARSVLGWQPKTSLEAGLQETVKYFKSVPVLDGKKVRFC
jgi:UDP-glucose 4-epimerase